MRTSRLADDGSAPGMRSMARQRTGRLRRGSEPEDSNAREWSGTSRLIEARSPGIGDLHVASRGLRTGRWFVDTTVWVDYFQSRHREPRGTGSSELEHQRLWVLQRTAILPESPPQIVRDDLVARDVARDLTKLQLFETGGPPGAERLLATIRGLHMPRAFFGGRTHRLGMPTVCLGAAHARFTATGTSIPSRSSTASPNASTTPRI